MMTEEEQKMVRELEDKFVAMRKVASAAVWWAETQNGLYASSHPDVVEARGSYLHQLNEFQRRFG